MPDQNDDIGVKYYRRLLKHATRLFAEHDVTLLCESILTEVKSITGAEGGSLYILRAHDQVQHLIFSILHNDKLGLKVGGSSQTPVDIAPIPLWDANGLANNNHIAAHAALTRQVVYVDDAYKASGFDFSGVRAFDKDHNYLTQSVLAIPLINDADNIVGVIQLVNATDAEGISIPFNKAIVEPLEIMCRFASVALTQQMIAREQKAILTELSLEPNTERMLERILDELQDMTYADGGTLYLLEEHEDKFDLRFVLMRNKTLGIIKGGWENEDIDLPHIPLEINGKHNFNNVASYAAITKKTINISDVYSEIKFDFSGTRQFDEKNGYRSQSFLTVPLLNHEEDVIGVIQLLNARSQTSGKVIPFNERVEPMVEGLASYAAIALNNRLLVQELKNLLDAFIKCIAQAIDAKSPHTSGHCQRVPLLTKLIAKAACDDEETFAEFNLNEDDWYELDVAAWLHDCGKLATPDSVLEKSTKLHLMHDIINEIATRFAAKKAQMQLQGASDSELSSLDDDLQFVIKANMGGEFMAEEDKHRIVEISKHTFIDAFGEVKPLLNEFEIKNLCIERGTLTHEERQIINNHMQVTIDMLESLPFPRKLCRVPEYAGGHHEKMDGTGFPRGLTRDEMSIPARMMAIADIFEALTAKDRPYKDPMKISQALSILKRMSENDHIDPDLFTLFVKASVWKEYAKTVLAPEQLDIETGEAYLV